MAVEGLVCDVSWCPASSANILTCQELMILRLLFLNEASFLLRHPSILDALPAAAVP